MPTPNRKFPVRVDLRLTEAERDYLNDEAIKRGMSRQEMLRELVLTPYGQVAQLPEYKPSVVSRGREAIDRAMVAVTRQYNCVPSSKLEGLICTVICALSDKR